MIIMSLVYKDLIVSVKTEYATVINKTQTNIKRYPNTFGNYINSNNPDR